jgi:Mycoplasma protein of unknown function, DUF285
MPLGECLLEPCYLWDRLSFLLDRSDLNCRGAVTFNSSIKDWDMGHVTTMKGIFYEAEAFDQDVSPWNVASVSDFSYAFSYAYAFTGQGNISSWNTSSAVSMQHMFHNGPSFQAELCWKELRPEVDVTLMFCDSGGRFRDDCIPSQVLAGTNMTQCILFSEDLPSASAANAAFFGPIAGWMAFSLLVFLLVAIYCRSTNAVDDSHRKCKRTNIPRSSDGSVFNSYPHSVPDDIQVAADCHSAVPWTQTLSGGNR